MQTHVLKIRDTLESTSWLFCPGLQNPADIPTRGSYLKDDNIEKFWLEERSFLELSQEDWPTTKNSENYINLTSHIIQQNYQIQILKQT